MSDDLKILAEDIVDFLNGIEASCVKLRIQIEKMLGSDFKRACKWDPGKIHWEKREGAKGEYERSEDVNNLEFKALVKDLAEHKGKLMREGVFYWLFQNGATVGRKKKQVSHARRKF